MIEFSGEVNQSTENFIVKKTHRALSVYFTCLFLIIGVALFFIALNFYKTLLPLIGLIALMELFFLILAIFPNICLNRKRDISRSLPIKVSIKDDEITREGKGDNAYKTINLYNVKKVFDYGEFYYFNFSMSFDKLFVCQKDLITEGTIEEFEKIFEGKIVRKF